jgi:hypothetical protein
LDLAIKLDSLRSGSRAARLKTGGEKGLAGAVNVVRYIPAERVLVKRGIPGSLLREKP